MREIDDPHHAEHERQAAGYDRVVAAEQDPLDDLIDDDHGGSALCRYGARRPKYAWVTSSFVNRLLRPSMAIAPSSMQIVRLAVDIARLRSCSTTIMATPEDLSSRARA